MPPTTLILTIDHPMFDLAVILLATTVLVVGAVVIHYEALKLLVRLAPWFQRRRRGGLASIVVGLILAHTFEIHLFALGYWVLDQIPHAGTLAGSGVASNSAAQYSYFSTVVFTTVGFGDIVPTGTLRTLVGMEALTGLLLITWSASYTFLYMQTYWKNLPQAHDVRPVQPKAKSEHPDAP